MKQVIEFLNGRKTMLCSIGLLVLQSQYAKEGIEPGLLDLITNIFWVAFGGSFAHHVGKATKIKIPKILNK